MSLNCLLSIGIEDINRVPSPRNDFLNERTDRCFKYGDVRCRESCMVDWRKGRYLLCALALLPVAMMDTVLKLARCGNHGTKNKSASLARRYPRKKAIQSKTILTPVDASRSHVTQ